MTDIYLHFSWCALLPEGITASMGSLIREKNTQAHNVSTVDENRREPPTPSVHYGTMATQGHPQNPASTLRKRKRLITVVVLVVLGVSIVLHFKVLHSHPSAILRACSIVIFHGGCHTDGRAVHDHLSAVNNKYGT